MSILASKFFKTFLFVFFISGTVIKLEASVLNCYPQLGNYNSGSVTSAGFKSQTSLLYAIGGGGERAWMKFDISDVPDGATINSVTLHYYVSSENAPYYQFRKVTSDPVTASGSTLFTEIGTGSQYIQITNYYTGWNTRLLGGTINTDVTNALVANWICIGLYEYETSSTWWLWVDGWNQLNKPYLEVNYTVNYANEIALDSITSPVNLDCEGIYPVKVKIRNGGMNAITSATISWSVNTVPQPDYFWTGNLAVNATEMLTLNTFNFTPGNTTIFANVNMPNGVNDPFLFNNYRTVSLQIVPKPLITLQPLDQYIGVGGDAIFAVWAIGGNITYQWQLSTDNGLTFVPLTNFPPYTNVTNNFFTVTDATQNMNGYKYRCVITGFCSPQAITDVVTLHVGPPVKAIAGTAFTCTGNLSTIPIIVKNLYNANNFTVTLNYNPAAIGYQFYNSLHPSLTGTFTVTNVSGHLTIQYTSSSNLTLLSDTICKLVFLYNSNSDLIWDTLVPGHCQFTNNGGLVYPSHYVNGFIHNGAPSIIGQPADKLTIVGVPTYFTVNAAGIPTYQWQVSVNGGSSWVNLSNNSTYNGVTTDSLEVIPTLSMNGYKYKCILNSCGVTVNSNSATMSVIKLVKTWFDTIYDCTCFTPAHEIQVPIKVANFDSINSVSLSFFFKNSALQYVSTTYINPALQFPILFTTVFPTKTMIRIASFTQTGFMAIADNAPLVILKFRVLCDTTKLQWETWNSGACQYSTGPDSSIYVFDAEFRNGFVLDGGPAIATSPANQSVYIANPATFSCSGVYHGGTLTYHWQVSTNGGSVYTDIADGTIYSGVLTNTLTVISPTLGMSGYKYRCRLNGLCDEQITNSATLTVSTPPVTVSIPAVNTCHGDTIFVPVYVTNFTGVCNANLTFTYAGSLMSFAGFKNLNPQLPNPGNFSCTGNGVNLAISWTSSTPGTLSGTPILVIVKFITSQTFTNSPLTWLTSPTAVCNFSDCTGGTFTYGFTNSSVTINPIPIVHNVITTMPNAGHFCAGSAGVQIGVDITQFGVNYGLFRNGVVVPGYGQVSGTGFGITFNTFNIPGIYTVTAFYPLTNCSVQMDQFATLVADPPPVLYEVTGTGSYCAGGAGLAVGLSNSQLNVDYFLYRDGIIVDTLQGSDSAISFGNQTVAGTYTVIGRNAIYETCPTTMIGSAVITISPYPSPATSISGSINVCKGSYYTYTVPPVTNANSYTWTTPGGFTGISNTPSILLTVGALAVSGNIMVSGHNNCGDGTASSLAVVVHDLPVVTQTSFPTLCKNGGIYTLTGGSPPGGTYSGPTVSGGTFNPALAGAGSFNITYSVTDGFGCIGTVQSTIVVVDYPKITGKVSYDNAAFTAMGNVKVYLKNSTNTLILDSTITSAVTPFGNYTFKCVLPSTTYNLACTTTRAFPMSEVNAQDALKIARYSVGLDLLSAFRIVAGDVNGNGVANAIDALKVMRRFVGLDNTFPVGNWLFNTLIFNPVVLGTTTITQYVSALAYGDVNASYVPSNVKVEPRVFLETAGQIDLNTTETFEIPIKADAPISAGSVSMVLAYPSSALEILSVSSSLKGFIYNVINDELRIAWYDLEPVIFEKGEPLFVISVRVRSALTLSEQIEFQVDPVSLFTNATAIPYEKVQLSIPRIKVSADNNIKGSSEFYLGCNQPNPFEATTMIPYYLPVEGRVVLEVFDMLGRKVIGLLNDYQQAGEHSLTIDGARLNEGVYTYRLTYTGINETKTISRKMIVQH